MSSIAEQIKALRSRTGAAITACKKALEEAGHDLEKAAEALLKAGLAKADKKADHQAAEGVAKALVSADGRLGVILEVNTQTDFVAREENFSAFVKELLELALVLPTRELSALLEAQLSDGRTVDEARRALVAKIGENIQVRRVSWLEAPERGLLASYVHGQRIAVLAGLTVPEKVLANDMCLHIAAMAPMVIDESDLPANWVSRERDIIMSLPDIASKPEEIAEKMVAGRLSKRMEEVTLHKQRFVKDGDKTIEQVLLQCKAQIPAFLRFEVGEGIEKTVVDFAEEVRSQVQG